MKPIHSVVLGAGLVLAFAIYVSPQTLEVGAVLPPLSGETLLGTPLVLPHTAAGKAAFLTVTFSKKAGKAARAWSERFENDYGSNSRVTTYSVAMLEEVPGIFRGMVKSGIKKGVPQQARDRFLVITSDEAAWKKYFSVSDDDLPYLLLIDAYGRVIWKDRGAFEEKKYEALRVKLGAEQSQSQH